MSSGSERRPHGHAVQLALAHLRRGGQDVRARLTTIWLAALLCSKCSLRALWTIPDQCFPCKKRRHDGTIPEHAFLRCTLRSSFDSLWSLRPSSHRHSAEDARLSYGADLSDCFCDFSVSCYPVALSPFEPCLPLSAMGFLRDQSAPAHSYPIIYLDMFSITN